MDRKALLDLGTRNRLVNISLGQRTSEQSRLLTKSHRKYSGYWESKRFTFLAAKVEASEGQPPSAPDDEFSGSIPQQFHLGGGNETGSRARHSDRRLQTKLSAERLQKRLLDIGMMRGRSKKNKASTSFIWPSVC